MRKGRSDDQTSERVPDERDLCETLDRAESLDILLYLICQTFTHLKDISFSKILISLAAQEYSLRVSQTQIILE
jgi:hypothetical protein